MEHISHEELHGMLSLIKDWISNCDSKVSILLSGIGVFIGFFLTSDYQDNLINTAKFILETDIVLLAILACTYVCFSVGSLAVLIYGYWNLIKVITARINPNADEFKSRGIYSDSLIFFGTIAKYDTLAEYKERLEKCSKEQMELDIISQIYICSIICNTKFCRYKKGLHCSIFGLFVFIIMEIMRTCSCAISITQPW